MPLKARLNEDLKNAMRAGDANRRNVLRFVLSAIHNEEIARRTDLDDDAITQVLSRQAQQRRDSIEAYTKGNRQDLVEKEQAELSIILEYLPEPMSKEEVTRIVKQAVGEVGASGPQDMGKVMGKVMSQVKGRAEGKEVSAMVTDLLRGMAE